MDGLTAKVFRTYNASITLQEQLKALTNREFQWFWLGPKGSGMSIYCLGIPKTAHDPPGQVMLHIVGPGVTYGGEQQVGDIGK